jgi:hypothetical protein
MGEYIAGGMSVTGGVHNMIQGAKQKRDARKALENYERQELKNVADGLQVSTIGADRRREEQARLAGTQIDALKGAGARGIIGGLGRVEAGNQNVNADIAANLDEQQNQIEQMKSQDDARIRQMQEQREQGDISALSSQYNTANESIQMGFGQAIGGLGAIGNKYANREKTDTDINPNPDVSSAKTQPIDNNVSATQVNNLSTGFMTKTGGSGLGATNRVQYDENGLPIEQELNYNFTPVVRRKRMGGIGNTN